MGEKAEVALHEGYAPLTAFYRRYFTVDPISSVNDQWACHALSRQLL
jgi:hypothetical protein